MAIVIALIVLLAGLAAGSFLNVCIHRIPAGESVVAPRSHCPACSAKIAWFDNIPMLSYLILKGRCRSCGEPIPLRYPLVEVATAGLFAWSYLYLLFHGVPLRYLPLVLPFYWWFAASLLALSVIDIGHQIIPDRITLPLGLVGLGFVLFLAWLGSEPLPDVILRSLLGAAAGGGVLWLLGTLGKALLRKEAMGMGDVKLMAAAGIWLGWEMALFSIFLGAVAAAVAGLVLIALGRRGRQDRLPFGPFLSIGCWLGLLYGWRLVRWYLSLYGF
ncbi:MAG TPA: prepilin peptidase [bacterium]|nr:prepilin peptidase [bacterium]